MLTQEQIESVRFCFSCSSSIRISNCNYLVR